MDKPGTSKRRLLLEDFIKRLEAAKNKLGVGVIDAADAVIDAISQLLKAKEASGTGEVPSNMESFIKCGQRFFEIINENTECISDKDNIFVSPEVTKVISEILQGLGKLHWTLGVLTGVGYLAHKIDEASNNKSECLQLLGYMINVARHVKNLAVQNLSQDEEEKLGKAMLTIIQGCMICSSQLKKGFFKRLFRSSVDSQTLSTVKHNIERLYPDLVLTAVIKLKPLYLCAPQPTFPEWAVGIGKGRKEVEQLLDMTRKEPLSVVIYGFGGIGKSTLADAVVARLDLKDFNYTKIEIDDNASNDNLKTLQEQILRCAFSDYMPGREIKLADCGAGRHHLGKAMEEAKKPVFIFIDNVLSEKYLSNLLPEKLRLPRHSRILLTTRDLRVTDWLNKRPLLRKEYYVTTLCHEDGIQILCNDPKKLVHIENDVQRILQICGGIPLVLKIVAGDLQKEGYKPENCNLILKALQEGQQIQTDFLSHRLVDFVYERLEISIQQAFLDICCFFSNRRFFRRWVEYIVGKREVGALKEAALITSVPYVESFDSLRGIGVYEYGEEVLKVNDVIRAKGKRMAVSTRLMDVRTYKAFFKAVQHLGRPSIEGVWLYKDHKSEYRLGERELRCMSHSLRVLGLGDRMSVTVSSTKQFKELRYLAIGGGIPCLPMKLEALEILTVYSGPIFIEGFPINKLPQNLRRLRAKAQSASTSKEPQPIQAGPNSLLEELDLSELKNQRILLQQIHQFTKLKILSLREWDQMDEVPTVIWRLCSLKKLDMQSWNSLKRLPESFAQISTLTHLDLSFCGQLEVVCFDYEKLTTLKYLALGYCEKLRRVQFTFGRRTALDYLDIGGCKALTKLPDNFGGLTSLSYLNLRRCDLLKQLPSSFGDLKSLRELDLSRCQALTELPDNFGKLTTLSKLNLSRCGLLKQLPSSFGDLKSLRELDLSHCYGLKELPPRFVQLQTLEVLVLEERKSLNSLPSKMGRNLKIVY